MHCILKKVEFQLILFYFFYFRERERERGILFRQCGETLIEMRWGIYKDGHKVCNNNNERKEEKMDTYIIDWKY